MIKGTLNRNEQISIKSPQLLRVLVVEDNAERIACFQAWKPKDVHFVLATSPGPALGLIKRDRGMIYAGVMLDHDLMEQSVCESEIEFSGTQVAAAIIENFSYEITHLDSFNECQQGHCNGKEINFNGLFGHSDSNVDANGASTA